MAGRRAPSRRPTVIAQTPAVDDAKTQRALDVVSGAVQELQGRALPPIIQGEGAPTLEAAVGTLYVRSDGGPNTTLYVRESTGWVAK